MNDINGIPLLNRVQLNNIHDYAEESIVDSFNADSIYNVIFDLNLEKLRLEQIDRYSLPLPTSFPIRVVLSWGGNGRIDFDAHLTGPAPGLPGDSNNEPDRFHVYFGDKNYESIRLNIDDFSDSQPEVVEIFPPPGQGKLKPGIYRYSVHHFQGNGDFVTAQVQVSLLINDQKQVFEPPLLTEDNIYWSSIRMLTWVVFELIVDEYGMIQVQPQQYYVPSNSPEVRRKQS